MDQEHTEGIQRIVSCRMDERQKGCQSDEKLQHKLVEPSQVKPIGSRQAGLSALATRLPEKGRWLREQLAQAPRDGASGADVQSKLGL